MTWARVFSSNRFFYSVIILVSLLLSLGMSVNNELINPDGVCYLSAAEVISQEGLTQGIHLCGQAKWPFYSVLISGLSQTASFSYLTSAYILNAVFSLGSLLVFIAIVHALGGSKRVLWCAAVIFLFSHELNSVRTDIIRDHGFWFFYLASFFFLLRYVQKPRRVVAFSFSASLLLATLFRIEGTIFLLTLPWLAWFDMRYSFRKRTLSFLTLNTLTLMMVCVLGFWQLTHTTSFAQLGRLSEVIHQFQHGFTWMGERFIAAKTVLAQQILTEDSVREAGLIVSLLLLVWYIVSVMSALSWIYSALLIYAWWCRSVFWTREAKRVLFAYILVNVIVTFSFLGEHFFLSKRYLIALSLLLMLWIPFALDDLFKRWNNRRYRFGLGVAIFFIVISSISGIVSLGYSKAYIREAGIWISQHVPREATLYANDKQLMYYTNHFGNTLFEKISLYSRVNLIAHHQWKHYDYLALRIHQNEKKSFVVLLQEIPLKPIQTFSNQRGDRVVIYRTHP